MGWWNRLPVPTSTGRMMDRPVWTAAARAVQSNLPLLSALLACALPAQDPAPIRAPATSGGTAGEPLFDGRTLTGFEGDPSIWSAIDGHIVGSTLDRPEGRRSSLIWTGGEVDDFELAFECKLEGDGGAALRYRCRRRNDAPLGIGYECSLQRRPEFFGRLYERGGRGIIGRRGEHVATHQDNVRPHILGRLAPATPFEPGRWHRVRIVARGTRISHEIDGALAVQADDRWRSAQRSGWLALDLSGDAPARVTFRDLRLRQLPAAAAATDAEPVARAKRIWCVDAQEQQEVWLRRQVLLRTPVAAARLTVSCDNHCHIFVNGVRVLTADDWQRPRTVDVAAHLRIGDNAIAIHATNSGGPAALAFWMTWTDPGGGGGTLVSDAAWRCSDEEHDGWERPRFDDSAWEPVHMHDGDSAIGQTVWGTAAAR